MVCVQCGQNTRVTNSRLQKRSNHVWRRRYCETCGTIFSTLEIPDYAVTWLVKGSDGRHLPYLRDKLFLSLYNSCQHRPTAVRDATELTDTIMRQLAGHVSGSVLLADQIRITAQTALDRFDQAAGVHYRAFH
jgi:transcriptional repressor NrdR